MISSLTKRLLKTLIIQITPPPIKAPFHDVTSTPLASSADSQNVKLFITKENRPRVKRLMGTVIKVIKGLIKAFTAPRIKPKNIVSSRLLIFNPGTNLAIKTTTAVVMQRRK